MYSEILDDDSEDKLERVKFVWKPRIVIAFLLVIVIWRFIEFPYFDFEFIWSILGLSIATYYSVINSSISIYATLILLGLGMFGVINHFNNFATFGVGSFIINLNYLGLLIVHAFLNSGDFLKSINKIKSQKSKNEEKIEKHISENRFLLKFQSKTDDELKRIIESPQYSKDALDAANEILKRRND